MSAFLDAMQAKDAIIAKQRDVIAKYAILDIERYLDEAEDRRLDELEEQDRQARLLKKQHSWWSNFSQLHKGRYADTPIWKIVRYYKDTMWQSWHKNPYNLHASWYLLMLLLLLAWLIGSTVAAFYEARYEPIGAVALAKLWRGILGSIPPMVQFILFLFPPLFANF